MSGRLSGGLARAREGFGGALRRVLFPGRKVDPALFEELLETLISGDTGVAAAEAVVDEVRERATREGVTEAEELRGLVARTVAEGLGPAAPLALPDAGTGLAVVLIVGVNGAGKTTTAAKLAARLMSEGRKPLLVQADTFRAAATEQMTVWAERLGLEVVHHRPGSDPAAVAFDGVRAAEARGRDVILVDTAGRLHTRSGLVEELRKISRVLGREKAGAPHETLLVVDGTAGLNSLEQARVFHEAVSLTGVVITKLDGTARGGVVLAIRRELDLPVKYVGIGEGLDDLLEFDATTYAAEMVGTQTPAG